VSLFDTFFFKIYQVEARTRILESFIFHFCFLIAKLSIITF